MSDAPTGNALRLMGPASTPHGKELCLHDEDILVAVNGARFEGTEKDLSAKVVQAKGRPLALTFARREHLVTVLSSSSRLGVWEHTVWSDDVVIGKMNPNVLSNWEILQATDGQYDLQCLTTGILALIAPPLWLLQMRLWIPGAALTAAGMVALAVSPFMFAAVYLAAGLHIWHAGPRYFRKDRKARGMFPVLVVAAPSEKAAHAIFVKFDKTARFVFAPASKAARPDQATSDQI